MRNTGFHLLRTAATTLTLALAAFAFGGAHAQAATYDGADPASTYCGGTTSTVSSQAMTHSDGTRVGTVYLRYNSGCRTVWAKVVLDAPQWDCTADYICTYGWIHRNSDGAELRCKITAGNTSCYTNMLNDAGVTSYAIGQADDAKGTATGITASY